MNSAGMQVEKNRSHKSGTDQEGYGLPDFFEVLKRKQFHFPPDIVDALLDSLRIHRQVMIPDSTGAVLPYRKDIPFYEAVMDQQEEGADPVAGNLKHDPRGNLIVSPREMIEIRDQGERNGMKQFPGGEACSPVVSGDPVRICLTAVA